LLGFYFEKLQKLFKMNSQKNIIKVRVHDGIVGLLNISSILLASQFGLNWIYVAVAVAVLQIISPITKFCPVYTILNKLMPDTEPIQNGK
jgi:phage shock protein PspC (stress-responsive transcriptional regulator)